MSFKESILAFFKLPMAISTFFQFVLWVRIAPIITSSLSFFVFGLLHQRIHCPLGTPYFPLNSLYNFSKTFIGYFMIRVSNKIIKALKIRKIKNATHHLIFLVKKSILRLNFAIKGSWPLFFHSVIFINQNVFYLNWLIGQFKPHDNNFISFIN